MSKNRYVMSWSQADRANLVVYANDLREAEEKFEDGDYVLEPDEREIALIPIWALRPLLQDRWEGVTGEQTDLMIDWTNKNRLIVVEVVNPYGESFFSDEPAFGEPCEVVDCYCEKY